MRWTVRFVVLAWVPLILFGSFPAVSQVVTATVPMLGIRPTSSVLNSANNTLYALSECNGICPHAVTLSTLFPTKSTPYSVFTSLMPSDVKEWSSDALSS